MSDYISRQAAIDAIEKHIRVGDELYPTTHDDRVLNRGFEVSASCVYNLPSADVQPVRHGHWQITHAYPHNVHCSECHERFAQTHWAVWEDGSLPRKFCPNCGARMDGEPNG